MNPLLGSGDRVTVTATVTNTGEVAGKEVAQLYVGFPGRAGEPPRQLQGFQKVALGPGKSADVTFELDARAFSYWDETAGWTIAKGQYDLMVGSSWRDIRLSSSFTVP